MSDKNIFEELNKRRPQGSKFVMGIVIAVFVLFALSIMTRGSINPIVTIGAGERGVVLEWGAVQDVVLDEGLHFIMPVMQEVRKMDVKLQKSQTEAAAASSDIQETRSVIALNYRIIPETANKVYQEIGVTYKEKVIDPAVQEVVKAVTARYSAVELITKRDTVREEIKALLKERLLVYNIQVVDFAILDFQFSKIFSEAIESKQTAEQLALKAKRDLERIEIEAQQKIASARAEATSLELQKRSVSPELIKLRQTEVQLKAIEKWDGRLPSVTGGAMPFIDAQNYVK